MSVKCDRFVHDDVAAKMRMRPAWRLRLSSGRLAIIDQLAIPFLHWDGLSPAAAIRRLRYNAFFYVALKLLFGIWFILIGVDYAFTQLWSVLLLLILIFIFFLFDAWVNDRLFYRLGHRRTVWWVVVGHLIAFLLEALT